MTRRQQKLQKRDIKIRELSKALPIEELAQMFSISQVSIYRILRQTTEKELTDYYKGK